MPMQNCEFQALLSRIEDMEMRCQRLARQGRRMKFALIVLPLIALAAGASLQDPDISVGTVTARRLIIKDDQERNRAVIEYREKRASFEMYDTNGARRVSLNVLDNGTASMYQHYPDGKMFSFGWMTPGRDGRGFPNFAFRGADGAVYANLSPKRSDSPPSFEVFSGDRNPGAPIGKLGGSK